MSFTVSQFFILSYFTLNLLVGGVMTSLEVTQKMDDGGPMAAIVEQLSQRVNSLDAEMAALKTKTDTLDKTVAFHVWNSAQPVRTTNYDTIILNHAVTNIGNAYDTLTGIFTAPVSGLYDLQTTIMSYNPGAKMYTRAGIYVGSSEVGRVISDSQHGHYSQSAIKAIVHVDAEQQVYLKNVDSSVSEYFDSFAEAYTTFSGFLIKAD